MAIAKEVARVAGWRERYFFGMSCRDIPSPPEITLREFLDNTAAYARRRQEQLAKELGLPREPTLRELLDSTLAYAKRTQARLRTELARERRNRQRKAKA